MADPARPVLHGGLSAGAENLDGPV
jgi:hypothetical protein